MNELQSIVEACREARRAGEAAVMATLVKVEGSSYRRPGARMVFPATEPPVGMISGGCLESDLAERARSVLASGTPHTVVYDMRSPDDIVWGLGLGCNGEVRVLLERLEPGRPPRIGGPSTSSQRPRRACLPSPPPLAPSGIAAGSSVMWVTPWSSSQM